MDIEKKVTEAAGNSAAQVLADERQAQRKQVLVDLQFIRNWSFFDCGAGSAQRGGRGLLTGGADNNENLGCRAS